MSAYVLTEAAERDLNDLWDYVAEDSGSLDQADAVASEIRDAMRLLAAAPAIGHRRPDVKDPRYRFWRANRFVIAYLPDTRPLQVIRIVGGHRDFRKLFRKGRP